jgi:hypothetical protein
MNRVRSQRCGTLANAKAWFRNAGFLDYDPSSDESWSTGVIQLA